MNVINWTLPPDTNAVKIGKSLTASFEKTVGRMQQNKSRGIIPISLGFSITSLLLTVATRVAAVAETAFWGLANSYGGLLCIPFLSMIKGVKQLVLDLPRTVLLAILSPVEGLIKGGKILGIGIGLSQGNTQQRPLEHTDFTLVV